MKHQPFYSANEYFQEKFGEKIYRLSLNGGMTCPNRDGKIHSQGCIFCSAGGSGDFAASSLLSISEQIDNAILKVSSKFKGNKYIAYFQAFTNTYAPVDYLRKIFTEAISDERIVALSIATRPDCLPEDVLTLLKELSSIKPIFVELGLQTTDEGIAKYIRRGYTLKVFEKAVYDLNQINIPVIVHLIIGLPGADRNLHREYARYLGTLNLHGVKLQLLHILSGTDLATDYENGKFQALSMEEYIETVIDMLELLPPDMVIHRITGDGPKKLLIAPLWSGNKKNVLNTINRRLRERETYQGRKYT